MTTLQNPWFKSTHIVTFQQRGHRTNTVQARVFLRPISREEQVTMGRALAFDWRVTWDPAITEYPNGDPIAENDTVSFPVANDAVKTATLHRLVPRTLPRLSITAEALEIS